MNTEESTNSKNNEQSKKSASRLIEKTTVPKSNETLHINKEDSSKDVQRTNKTTLEYLVDVMKVNENTSQPGILKENITQHENNTQTGNLIENVPQGVDSSKKSLQTECLNEVASQTDVSNKNNTQTGNLIENVPQGVDSSKKSLQTECLNEVASKTDVSNKNINISKKNDPSVILGAACAFSSNIPELIKDVKKNTTTASTFDVFIVNEEGKINSYEINHYVEEDINNQLYSTIKTPSEKKDSYQKKLRNIVNEIKQGKIEPIKENEPTILEISHYDDIKDNVLVICYCGNGVQSENCMCTRDKKNENEEDKFSSCSELSEEEPLITKSAFDNSSEEVLYEASNDETTISNENTSLGKKQTLNTVLEGDNMSLHLVEEKLPSDKSGSLNTVLEGDNMSLHLVEEKMKSNQTCEPPCPIEHHQKTLNNIEKDSYGLSKEWERMISNKEDKNPDNQIIVEQMIVNNSECSMGTHTLAEALNVNESEIIVNELVEHNTELLKKESLQEEEIVNNNIDKKDLSCEESSEVIILHENLKSQIKERSCNATKNNFEKASTLTDFNIKSVRNINLSNSNVLDESAKSLKPCPIESNTTQEKSVSQHQTVNSIAHESLKPCPIESNTTREITNFQGSQISTKKTDVLQPSVANLNSSLQERSINSQKSNILTLEAKELQDSSNLNLSSKDKSVVSNKNSKVSSENKQNSCSEESANYVEIEIHLSDNNNQLRSENEANSSPNNSLITFIENDKANYSQTLQNIRKNRVGSLVSFYEELNKKSKEDK